MSISNRGASMAGAEQIEDEGPSIGSARESAGMLLADEIERQIRDASLLPGAVFASERDLQSRSDTGRSVVRQAVRLLEQRGVASMRRGVGGGLIVKAPDVEAAARNLSLAIEREIQGYPDLSGLFMASDAYLFACRTDSVSSEQADLLRGLAGTLNDMSDEQFEQTHGHRRMVIAFFKAFGDAAGTLAVRAAMECGMDLIPRALGEPEERLRGEFWRLTLQSVEALIAGDVAALFAIRVKQSRFFASSSEWSEMDRAPRASGPYPEQTPGLKAEHLAREILRDIRLRGWTPGTRLGGFHELASRYRSTPAVLREAIRILEENSAVFMQLGRGAGLMVAAPDRRKAVLRAINYLRAVRYPQTNAWRFLDEILLEAVARGAAGASPDRLHSLQRAVGAVSLPSGASVDTIRQMYRELAGVGDNAPLRTIAEILLQVACPVSDPPARVRWGDPADLQLLCERLAAGDPARARRAYLSHAQSRRAAATP
jgi:DNA-binding FadR family transcriptional regulator